MGLREELKAKGTAEQVAMVERVTREAGALLDLVRDTFPTYTLHNHVHAENVVARMEDLLGDAVERVTALEAAVLLLSAYLHDIGMVFEAGDLAGIADEPEFDDYLKTHPADYVAFRQRGLTDEIAEGYCRWRHADRVYVHLNRWDLRWGTVPLRDALGEVCRSHNQAADFVLRPDFDVDFLGECDLRFCAILLRLADILDFDNSRSPEPVYHSLGIARRVPRSEVEWRKHLASDGFRFPEHRPEAYEVVFRAGPKEPAVEYDVRQFLDVIEGELAHGRSLLRACSDRWRDFTLPARITRANIKSGIYRYGDFRFHLDREAVLQLFMGDKLYSDPMVFVRELLQNAVDATRVRSRLEDIPIDAPEIGIDVWSWTDDEGNDWIRVDDNGTGMDQEIVDNYLLRVGRSYYNSAQFVADVLRYEAAGKPRIVPISRFGIGILSCFIVGDRVEISTCRSLPGGAVGTPIRISMSGLQDFFTVQTPPWTPSPMPDPRGEISGRRPKPGTSVAVRIDPSKAASWQLTPAKLNDYVFAPPMRIMLNGEIVGHHGVISLAEPWTEPFTLPLSPDQRKALSGSLCVADVGDIRVRVDPIDVTGNSPTPLLAGQLVSITLDVDETRLRPDAATWLSRYLDLRNPLPEVVDYLTANLAVRASLSWGDDSVEAHFSWSVDGADDHLKALQSVAWADPSKSRLHDSLSALVGKSGRSLTKAGQAVVAMLMRMESRTLSFKGLSWRLADLTGGIPTVSLERKRLRWTHNAVEFPANFALADWLGEIDIELRIRSDRTLVLGAVALYDEFRPSVAVSREELKELPFPVYSALMFVLRRARGDVIGVSRGPLNGRMSLADLTTDPLLGAGEGWQDEPLFEVEKEPRSARDLRGLPAGTVLGHIRLPHLRLYASPSLWGEELDDRIIEMIRAALLQLHVDVAYAYDGWRSSGLVVSSARSPVLDPGIHLFPPLYFVPYEREDLFCARGGPINSRHPFARWFIDHAEWLSTARPAVFAGLRQAVAKYPSYSNDTSRAGKAEVDLLLRTLRRDPPDIPAAP